MFNITISGTSVSGDLDTSRIPLAIQMANADAIGYASFALQNKDKTYTNLTVSGNATIVINFIPASGITQTLFRGTVERIENTISVIAGSQTVIHAYDQALELLNIISPDARPASVISGGTLSLVSGDQGLATQDGMDLAIYVSGLNPSSGATLSSFMAQFFGRSGDFSGSFSGSLFSFKPHISGYTWRTWYFPAASGGVITNDTNANYWIPRDTLKVKREYGWDTLRRLCRQAIPIDRSGYKTQFDIYIGVSGDIHIFTSGSFEFPASGVTLQFYVAGASGAHLNNIIDATIPFDTTKVKNHIIGWFPAQTTYPLDSDTFTDLVAYSGISGSSYWSGVNTGWGTIGITTLSGDTPGVPFGSISIMVTARSGKTDAGNGGEDFQINYRHLSGTNAFNIQQYNVSGVGGVNLVYYMKYSGSLAVTAEREVVIYDSGGNTLMKSGNGNDLLLRSMNTWTRVSDVIYGSGGILNSGTGIDGGWAVSSPAPTLSQVSQLKFGLRFRNPLVPGTPEAGQLWIDGVHFEFNYPFSPVTAFNSGSQGMGYGRRYAIFEYPFRVSVEQASGIITHELNSRMGSKEVAEFMIKDNPVLVQSQGSAQLQIKPGQIFVVDAPSLNTGSGQTFYYWKAIDVTHGYSTARGFTTKLRAVPWFSGTLTDPNTNLIDYTLPLQQPIAKRIQFIPHPFPYPTTAP